MNDRLIKRKYYNIFYVLISVNELFVEKISSETVKIHFDLIFGRLLKLCWFLQFCQT